MHLAALPQPARVVCMYMCRRRRALIQTARLPLVLLIIAVTNCVHYVLLLCTRHHRQHEAVHVVVVPVCGVSR